MRSLDVNDVCDYEKRVRKSTDGLLALLREHHDFAVPYEFVTKRDIIEIRSVPDAPAVPIEVCILPIDAPKLTVDGIKRVVCKHFGISHNDLVSSRRDHDVQRPRMIAIYLAKEFTQFGLPTLGRHFKRDHTTILYNIRKTAELVAAGDVIARDVTYLREVLTA